MYNPNPFSSKLHTTLYIGYSLSEAKKKWRQYLGLERKHIQWEEFHGVIGPMANGNCRGSAGQCVDEIRAGEPVNEWTQEMLEKLCDIWDEWHLNDMRPYCEHQKQLGWNKLASKPVTLYHYRMTREASKKQKEAEKAALSALKNGETFVPTQEQVKFASMEYSLVLPTEIEGELAEFYEPKKPLWAGDQGPTEIKTLGWLRKTEHPDGILCKPCPVCGYKYRTSWLKEEVPKDVLDWLFHLPDAKVKPAWS